MLTVISGPMFSGKTEFMLNEFKFQKDTNKNLKYDLFTPYMDKRWKTGGFFKEGFVCSRTGNCHEASILKLLNVKIYSLMKFG